MEASLSLLQLQPPGTDHPKSIAGSRENPPTGVIIPTKDAPSPSTQTSASEEEPARPVGKLETALLATHRDTKYERFEINNGLLWE